MTTILVEGYMDGEDVFRLDVHRKEVDNKTFLNLDRLDGCEALFRGQPTKLVVSNLVTKDLLQESTMVNLRSCDSFKLLVPYLLAHLCNLHINGFGNVIL